MKRFFLLSFLLISVVLLQSRCGLGDAAENGEKYANKFHKHLLAHDEKAMLNLIHEEAMANEEEAFRELIARVATEMDIEHVEKSMGFNTSINNGVATVTLNYILHDKKHGEITEQIILRDSNEGGMKIIALQYH